MDGREWEPTPDDKLKAAFLVKVTETDSTAFLEENAESKCILEGTGADDDMPLIYLQEWCV